MLRVCLPLGLVEGDESRDILGVDVWLDSILGASGLSNAPRSAAPWIAGSQVGGWHSYTGKPLSISPFFSRIYTRPKRLHTLPECVRQWKYKAEWSWQALFPYLRLGPPDPLQLVLDDHTTNSVLSLIYNMRQSVAYGSRASQAPSSTSSAAALTKLIEKKKEFDAVSALERASTQYLERIQELADDCEVMADAGQSSFIFITYMVKGQYLTITQSIRSSPGTMATDVPNSEPIL